MIPPTHFLISWAIAVETTQSRRDRALVALAGVIPDIDGFGYPVENWITANWDDPVLWFSDYHHVLCHNIGFASLVTGLAAIVTRRWKVACLVAVTFHLHLLCDVMGSRGIDNYQWPVPYLEPFSDRWQWTWDGQWELSSWPNRLIAVFFLGLTLWQAWDRGWSPLEVVSPRANDGFVTILRKWFPRRAS